MFANISSRSVEGQHNRRCKSHQRVKPAREAIVFHPLESLEERNLLTATLSLNALGVLYGANGNPLANGSAIVILVDTGNDGFGDLSQGSTFSSDSDDKILGNAILTSNDLAGAPGLTGQQIIIDFAASGGADLAGKKMMLVWYDKQASAMSVSGGPGSGVRFGTYRTDNIQDFSDIGWTVPADGLNVTLNFLTDSIDGAGNNPESDGEVKFITGGSGPVNQPPVLSTIGNRSTSELTPLSFTASANDPDVGNTLTYSLDAASLAAGMAINANTGQFTWTPTEQQGPGLFSVTITVADNGSPTASDSETFSIQVSEQNVAPVLAPIGNQTVAEGQPLTVNVSATDSDLPANGIVISVTGLPSFASLTDNGNGTGSITFAPGFSDAGPYSINVTATDNGSPALSNTKTFSLTVTNVNSAPDAVNDTRSTNEDTQLVITAASLLTNDTDIDGDTLTVTSVGSAVNGSVSLAGSNITFTPNANFNGPASFTYTISDGNGGTDTATVNITVNPVNDVPVANDDTASTSENQPVVVSVLTNDTDVDGNTLTVTSVTNGTNGSVTTNGTTVTYTPNANFSGSDSFTYTISDGNGGTDTATVNITVGGVNDAPDAVNDTRSTNEDTPLIIAAASLLTNDTDIDGDTLTVTSVGSAVNGSVSLAAGNITFTPSANFIGPASFTYTISDGNGGTDTATVNITVGGVNDAPDAVNDTRSTNEDTPLVITAASLTSNDSDIDGDTLTVTSVGSAVNGSVSLAGGNITFTPSANFNGPASFTYTISDGNGGTDSATVNITVNPVNDAPVANDDIQSGTINSAIKINVLTNDTDIDGDTLAVIAVTQGVNGTVSGNGTTVTYTPNTGFIGIDTFTYTISDGNGGTDTGSITVNIAAATVSAYAISDSINALAALDAATGMLTVIGELRDASNTLYDDIEAIAFDPFTGSLFGVQQNITAGNSTLVTINTTNAHVTVIGVIAAIDIDALTFEPTTGDLWGVDDTIEPTSGPTDPGRLIRIDKTTGAILQSVKLIKAAVDPLDALDAFDPGIDGLAFEPGTGRLLAAYSAWGQIVRDVNGNAINVLPGIPTFLFELDKTTGQMTVIGNTGVKDMEEIAFDTNGVLHGSLGDTGALNPSLPGTFPGSFEGLVSLNTLTGVATEVGSYGPAPLPAGPDQNRWDIEALAFVPVINNGGSSAQEPVAQPQPAMLQIAALDNEASEDGNNAAFSITRTGDTSQDLIVQLSRSGSAKFGAKGDYLFQCNELNASATSITIPAGQSSVMINVIAQDDNKVEMDKQATLSIRKSKNYQIADNAGSASVTVADDEIRTLSINDVTIREGNDGVRLATFTVTLSAASSEDITVDLGTVDGTAIAGLDYNALAPATITFASGQTKVKVAVEVLGDLIDEDNQTFFVNLSNAVNAVIADAQGIGTIKDDDAAPNIRIGDVSVIEGDQAQFEVRLSAASERTITVDASTFSAGSRTGVAVADLDYTARTTTITFNPGETSAFVIVDTLADGDAEVNELFAVKLRNASNARIRDAIGLGAIVDSAAPSITISDAQIDEPVNGTANLTFEVTLSEPAATPITVKYTVPPGLGAGKAGIFDIKPILVGTVTFEAGQTTRTIDVLVKSDELDEADETVTVTLLSSNLGIITDAQGVGVIIDDDQTPTLAVNDMEIIEGNGGRKFAVVTVTLSSASGREITVDVETADDTATAGEDYAPVVVTTLTFLPGQTSKRLLIPILGDRIIEADETFSVNLSNANNATITDAQGIVAIHDND